MRSSRDALVKKEKMNTPQVSGLSADQLDRMKRRLTEEDSTVTETLRNMEERELPALHRDEESNDGYGDDAKTTQIRQRLINRTQRFRKRQVAIRAALLRIQNGTYGIDQQTGAPIRWERLVAVPTAQTALDHHEN